MGEVSSIKARRELLIKSGFEIVSYGVVYNNATLSINGSSLSANSTGAGIFNNGTPTITNSTFSDDEATTDGGGIFNNGTCHRLDLEQ